MNQFQLIDSYFNTGNFQFDLNTFLIDLSLVFVLSFILGLVYLRFGTTVTSRKSFVALFPILALTTMLIISVIRSSLALSLGLVGALSIVRFRSAIKEPEELAYLFLTISLGLGFGASQRYITIVAFLFILVVIIARGVFTRKSISNNLFVTLSAKEDLNLEEILGIIKPLTSGLSLKRVDHGDKYSELVFFASFKNASSVQKLTDILRDKYRSVSVSLIEDRGVYN